MNADRLEIKEIFCEALEKATLQERIAYLDKACAGRPEVYSQVNELLRLHEGVGDFLESPVLDPDISLEGSQLTEQPGTVIGRYKLLEKIGEGGMAVVYMAEQAEPIRRKVALKIIKLGMDTKQVIARFEAERQALAMMDHPNIAKVHDAGATETGRPYFVMELVQGVSITEYCDQSNLSTKERLALFIQVCNAVQHAHQKGIIHRDIKPSNVMVTRHDGRAVPKVIDFGIAKATNQRLTEKTLFTRYAHIIGTPAYMSPEQAELSDLDVDTRSDIYSLGVLLYELLTGTPPFTEEELRKVGYLEMQRVIREQEPAKPSTKLSTLGDTLTDVAGRRSTHPDVLRRAVRGDLDWIVMKALEKDRIRRYETANGLAEDVRRHLDGEPVLARGPGAAYRVQKFLHRHRVQALGALVIAVVAGGAIVILSMWNRDRLELAEAESLRHRKILSQAREQYAKADREAALETIEPILDSKHVGPEAHLLRAGILVDNRRPEEAVAVLEDLLDDEPEIAGTAHSLLARILWESESPTAETLQEIEEHRQKSEALLPETAEAHFLRAMTALTVKGQLASLDRALQLDPGHYESRRLRAFTYHASRKYDRLRDDALAMTILRPRDPLGYSLRAIAWRELGRYPAAIADYDSAIALTSPTDPQYLDLIVQRSEVFLRMADYERVIAEAQECPKPWPDDPILQYHMFSALTALGDYDKAAALFRQIIAPGPDAQRRFQEWCVKHVFDTVEAGQTWHPDDRPPEGAAFLPMLEAEETYRSLSAKGHRLTDGFTAAWSPDGTKLAFSMDVHGYSGVAVFDPVTKETELLTVPGKDPRWSPDGRYIAFGRDCQARRIAEFVAAEHKNQARAKTDEEVWVMSADGTEPRRLASGGQPSWSQDSTRIYYFSGLDNALCSISIAGSTAEPELIVACPGFCSWVSPDNQRMAYTDGVSLKVIDLGTQTLAAEWPVPTPACTWSRPAWSALGSELCMGGGDSLESRTGLWIYDLARSEPVKTLCGQISYSDWAADGTKLLFCLGKPYFEIWAADLDPNVSTTGSLGPAQTIDGHSQELVAVYTRRIEADPADAGNYLRRAEQYQYLREAAKMRADMRRHHAILNQGFSSDPWLHEPWTFMRAIDGPLDHQFVVFVERWGNGIYVLRVASGQKGRCHMKPIEIPMVVTSLLSICFLSGMSTPTAHADFIFGEPENLGTAINGPGSDAAPCLSADGLSLYFMCGTPADVWVARRATLEGDWEPASNLGQTVNMGDNGTPFITPDGLMLFTDSDRPGGCGSYDLWVTTRATVDDDWSPTMNLGERVNSASEDWAACLSSDGLELYFTSDRPGGYGHYDLWVTSRTVRSDNWGPPVNLGPTLNTSAAETFPSISADGLLLFFCSSRPGGYGSGLGLQDLYMARRATTNDPWSAATNLGPKVNSTYIDSGAKISADGSMLYFQSNRPGGVGNMDLWQVPIVPLVDFNGDSKVDGKDVLKMAEHWGLGDSTIDIGPTPLGDGIVDVADLIALAGYIGAEIDDPSLLAHWPLDETDGVIASDNIGDHDGTVIGHPVWQATSGQTGGALQLDGSTFVTANSVLSPTDGPFSALVWAKGGSPGEVILSQANGANWLSAEAGTGALMTGLCGGRQGRPLYSVAIITDDNWHRVAFTWDGANRRLYVDQALVAEDTQEALGGSFGQQVIGCGASMSADTFFTGLIDDVRIYNRAVKP